MLIVRFPSGARGRDASGRYVEGESRTKILDPLNNVARILNPFIHEFDHEMFQAVGRKAPYFRAQAVFVLLADFQRHDSAFNEVAYIIGIEFHGDGLQDGADTAVVFEKVKPLRRD